MKITKRTFLGIEIKLNEIYNQNNIYNLINENSIEARIDNHRKILFAKNENEKNNLIKKSNDLAQDYLLQSNHSLMRMQLIQDGLTVKSNSD